MAPTLVDIALVVFAAALGAGAAAHLGYLWTREPRVSLLSGIVAGALLCAVAFIREPTLVLAAALAIVTLDVFAARQHIIFSFLAVVPLGLCAMLSPALGAATAGALIAQRPLHGLLGLAPIAGLAAIGWAGASPWTLGLITLMASAAGALAWRIPALGRAPSHPTTFGWSGATAALVAALVGGLAARTVGSDAMWTALALGLGVAALGYAGGLAAYGAWTLFATRSDARLPFFAIFAAGVVGTAVGPRSPFLLLAVPFALALAIGVIRWAAVAPRPRWLTYRRRAPE